MWGLETFSEERLVLKMEEQNIEDLGLKPIETWSRDKDGNLIKVKLY
jgi:hypothetical protein